MDSQPPTIRRASGLSIGWKMSEEKNLYALLYPYRKFFVVNFLVGFLVSPIMSFVQSVYHNQAQEVDRDPILDLMIHCIPGGLAAILFLFVWIRYNLNYLFASWYFFGSGFIFSIIVLAGYDWVSGLFV